MTLPNYYQLIKSLIESDKFSFKAKSPDIVPTREECIKNSHLESIHYLMFEFMSDRKDKRKKDVFDYVCIPKGVNKGENDIDFTKYDTEDFLKEVMKLKD